MKSVPSITRLLWLSIVLLLPAPSLAAGPEKTVFTSEDVSRIRSVRTAKVSPDGAWLAWTVSVPRTPFKDEDGGPWEELYVGRPGTDGRLFIGAPFNLSGLDWSPDSRGISFLAKRGDDRHQALYVIPVDGGEARKRLVYDEEINSYAWSPDGTQVAFLAREKDQGKKKRDKLKEQGFKAEVFEETSRPVRLFIATLGERGDDAQVRKLDLPGSASELHWSPRGNQVVVCTAPTPHIDDQYMARTVHVVDVQSGNILADLEHRGKKGGIRWSPDGKRLAMIGAEDIHDPREGRLMVADASGGSFMDLLPGYAGHVQAIAWQDGETLLYVGHEGTGSVFGEVTLAGKRKTILRPKGEILRSLSLNRAGNLAAFTADAPAHPRELFTLARGEQALLRVTRSNPWMAGKRLARQETVEYTARDGLKIQGVLMHPLDRAEGEKVPLILAVHGGPEAHRSNGWLTRYSSPGQVAAARGFAVFYPNYRGSTGRGVAFSRLGQADYGGGEFNDLVDGIEHLAGTGLIDKDKVGITGGSYGGFATAWAATALSEHFAAGVMFVGIADHISKAGTTDIPNEMFLVHSRTLPWKDWDFFLERSPIYHVEDASTPLLILTGKEDTRVHPSQSLELYRYLKMAGKAPVRLVVYPGEGHGNRKAAARYDYNLRMMRWLEHYLKGEGGDPPAHEPAYDKRAFGVDDDEAE